VVPVRSGLPPTRKRTCSTTPDEDWYSIVPPGKGSCSACEDPFNNPDEAWYRPVHTKDIRATVTVETVYDPNVRGTVRKTIYRRGGKPALVSSYLRPYTSYRDGAVDDTSGIGICHHSSLIKLRLQRQEPIILGLDFLDLVLVLNSNVITQIKCSLVVLCKKNVRARFYPQPRQILGVPISI